MNNSEFYNFGILPQICIHSLIEDEYSKMYIPQEICSCGCAEWIESTMNMFYYSDGSVDIKKVHRCKTCNDVRIATHVGYKENEK